jgi:hypothetical protein
MSLFAHSATDRLWPGGELSDDLTAPQPDDRANKNEQNLELPCDLLDGEIQLDGELFQLLPIPFDRHGSVQFDLECMPMGNKIRITGSGLRLEMLGVATYVEEVNFG